VLKYFEENRDTLIPVYLPTASPEFMVMEEVWNIAKRDLLVINYYPHRLQILKTRYLDISEQKGLILI
jgi:transposase